MHFTMTTSFGSTSYSGPAYNGVTFATSGTLGVYHFNVSW